MHLAVLRIPLSVQLLETPQINGEPQAGRGEEFESTFLLQGADTAVGGMAKPQ
jgi:hypothetical protein